MISITRKTIFHILKIASIWFLGISVFSVILFRWVPVPVTPLMLIRCVEQKLSGEPVVMKHKWVPIEKMSKNLQLAVICSEDQKFAEHFGFDLNQVKAAVESNVEHNRKLRGASTISQQTAKNVFLWPGRSFIRKGFELYFTGLIEIFWGKERIMEVYLNSIEMGDGVYGAEAATRCWYHKSCRRLTKVQAASIAAILPNPRKFKANPAGSYVRRRIGWITNQMNHYKDLGY
ncbi:MAG: monofunctional biosynthetic peptidoglycan transglycosylase [Bacteroidota bacterium]|nr:monofunctional biosynthetic peptidoglycan transglycosylase [Bacteroidota bacterium]MDP4206468.1 monofunctional biosynthetic peptidoglycan transglycosylase [Bacteroidota bacterium]